MAHVCPWWLGYPLISRFRWLFQNPSRILAPFVRDGMRVLEPGSGMGFFTLELARLVGTGGKVVAIDLQPKMLRVLDRRARAAGLEARLETRTPASEQELGLSQQGMFDFVLVFWMAHELPDSSRFFAEVLELLKPGGTMLLAEPLRHVAADEFALTLAAALAVGFQLRERPGIPLSRAALLARPT